MLPIERRREVDQGRGGGGRSEGSGVVQVLPIERRREVDQGRGGGRSEGSGVVQVLPIEREGEVDQGGGGECKVADTERERERERGIPSIQAPHPSRLDPLGARKAAHVASAVDAGLPRV